MCYRLAGKHVTLMGGKVIAYKLHSNGAAALRRHVYYSSHLASFLVGSFAYLAILLCM